MNLAELRQLKALLKKLSKQIRPWDAAEALNLMRVIDALIREKQLEQEKPK